MSIPIGLKLSRILTHRSDRRVGPHPGTPASAATAVATAGGNACAPAARHRAPSLDPRPLHNRAMTASPPFDSETVPNPLSGVRLSGVRFARPDDIGAIVALIRELADYEQLSHLATATPETLSPHLFGERPACECLVGERAGEVVGFALFFHNFSTFLCRKGLYLEDLYVRPAARGTGLGRAMLERLARLAVERGCGRFEWAVLDWNVDAQAFYRRMGATVLPDWRLCRVAGEALQALASGSGGQ
jgi:GNAT superfamily N-acetyltransferase